MELAHGMALRGTMGLRVSRQTTLESPAGLSCQGMLGSALPMTVRGMGASFD